MLTYTFLKELTNINISYLNLKLTSTHFCMKQCADRTTLLLLGSALCTLKYCKLQPRK
jgi:hypothetical protein